MQCAGNPLVLQCNPELLAISLILGGTVQKYKLFFCWQEWEEVIMTMRKAWVVPFVQCQPSQRSQVLSDSWHNAACIIPHPRTAWLHPGGWSHPTSSGQHVEMLGSTNSVLPAMCQMLAMKPNPSEPHHHLHLISETPSSSLCFGSFRLIPASLPLGWRAAGVDAWMWWYRHTVVPSFLDSHSGIWGGRSFPALCWPRACPGWGCCPRISYSQPPLSKVFTPKNLELDFIIKMWMGKGGSAAPFSNSGASHCTSSLWWHKVHRLFWHHQEQFSGHARLVSFHSLFLSPLSQNYINFDAKLWITF